MRSSNDRFVSIHEVEDGGTLFPDPLAQCITLQILKELEFLSTLTKLMSLLYKVMATQIQALSLET